MVETYYDNNTNELIVTHDDAVMRLDFHKVPDVTSVSDEQMKKIFNISEALKNEAQKEFFNDLAFIKRTTLGNMQVSLDNFVAEITKPIIVQGNIMPRISAEYTGKKINFDYGEEKIVYSIHRERLTNRLVFIRNKAIRDELIKDNLVDAKDINLAALSEKMKECCCLA